MPKPVNYYARKKVYDNEIIVAAGDVETRGLGGELLMIQFGIFSEVWHLTGADMVPRFMDAIRLYPKPVIWYFHFGQYDWRYFLDYFAQSELKVQVRMRTETDIYEIQIYFEEKGPPVILRDSYAIWPGTLESLATNFCPEIPKLEIDIANFDPENPDHIRYARRDIEILLTGLPRMFDYLHELFGVTPGATTAGTAIRAWQKTLGDEIYNGQEWGDTEQYIRNAYYGGLVFLTTTRAINDCETFDLNSSYPASMRDFGVPYGRVTETDDFKSGKLGIYRCRVRAPDGVRVPILPGRNARGAMRWFAGEFDTQVTSSELVFAAQHGYEILEIYDGIYFEDHIFPFGDFVSKCKLIRDEFKGTARETLAKLMQNSSYGRYGARRLRRSMLSAYSDDADLEGTLPFDESGNWYVREEFDEEMLCLPQWAVFITAHSRLRLLKAVYDIGPENCLYGDTDSLTVRAGFAGQFDVGPDYGQWKLEKEWQVFRAIAPKVYTGILKDGTFKGAAKGLPKKGIEQHHWGELLEKGETSVLTESLSSLRVAFKKGISASRPLLRQSSNLNNSANFALAENGDVRLKSAHET